MKKVPQPADEPLRNELTEIMYGADWRKEYEGVHKPDVEAALKLIDRYTATKVTEAERQAKYEVLQDLVDWHDMWNNRQEFNWYGAVKAMQVMKDPRKPFIEFERTRAATNDTEKI
jgi:hypothetical protein